MKKRKIKFEEYDDKINKKINDNINKLSNIKKELCFNNCSNHFLKLIFKFINHNNNTENSSNYELDYLKIKKCVKEYFHLNNIISLKN